MHFIIGALTPSSLFYDVLETTYVYFDLSATYLSKIIFFSFSPPLLVMYMVKLDVFVATH